jgi:transposase
MLHAGVDVSRRRLDVCVLDARGEVLAQTAVPPDADGVGGLAGRLAGLPVRAVIESVNGARLVHDAWRSRAGRSLSPTRDGQGPRATGVRPTKIDARVLAELSWRDLVPAAIWLPDPTIRRERELARFGLHLVRHRTALKNRIPAALISFGPACPVSDDLFGLAGRRLLDRLEIPDPWRRNVDLSVGPIDGLELQIARLTVELRQRGAEPPLHPAAGHRARLRVDRRVHGRLGDRRHRALRVTGQAVRLHRPVPARHLVRQHRPPRRALKARPALPVLGPVRGRHEACRHPLYAERSRRTKRRLGRQRGPKVARSNCHASRPK